jgi:antitoxin ParD1/3/4
MASFVNRAYSGSMATMNVSLPDGLKKFVEAQVDERGYGTSSEFVRELIRREQARTQLRALVVDGMGSGPGSEMDEAYFQRMRERIRSSGPA